MTLFTEGHAPAAPVSCAASCGWQGSVQDLAPIALPAERLSGGEILPPGECPKCGAVAHLDTPLPGSAQHQTDLYPELLALVREVSAPGGVSPTEFSRPGGFRARCLAAIAKAEGTAARLIKPAETGASGTG